MHLVYPSREFCKTSVFDFSCDDCNTQGKLEVIVMYNFFFLGGGGGVGRERKDITVSVARENFTVMKTFRDQ